MRRFACPNCLLDGTVRVRHHRNVSPSEKPFILEMIACDECSFRGMAFLEKGYHDGFPVNLATFNQLEKLFNQAEDEDSTLSEKSIQILHLLREEKTPPEIAIDWTKRFPMEFPPEPHLDKKTKKGYI